MKNKIILKKSTIILIFINISVFFLLLIARCKMISLSEKNLALSMKLLPPSILKDTKEIVLNSPSSATASSSFRIIKEEPAWLLKMRYSSYYVKKDKIEAFISLLSKDMDAYFITDNLRDYHYYGVDDDSSFNVRFIGSDKNILLDIYFGSSDAVHLNRYVRRGNVSSSVFSVPDGMSHFLLSDASFWVDMQVYKEKLNGNHITYIEQNDERIWRDEKNEEVFLNLEKTLASLTMINVFDGLRVKREKTFKCTFGLEIGKALDVFMEEMEGGDYIFFDNSNEFTPYILSAYSKNRLQEAIDALK